MNNQEKEKSGQDIHNHVIGWTENCDTKASIMIAFIGIFASIFFTSDYILNSLQSLITHIAIYWTTGEGQFDFLSLIVFITLGLTLVFIGMAILLLFNVLAGKTTCNEDSVIFFHKIQNQSFEEYYDKINSINEDELLKDRFLQIYNCSRRCTEKFASYNKAIKKMKYGLLFLGIFMICILIVNS
ncbi:hypothetical protein Barb4_01560 [Bacteroidales bacterium Barb4]|nr:hypothetical protein Barb4_01560 [Bacteroidales bacterium Barb4]